MARPEHAALYRGDCLERLRGWEDACVDLIYLDPPFNSQAGYSMLYGANGGGRAEAFADRWAWDAAAAERTQRLLDGGAEQQEVKRALEGLRTMLGRSGMMSYLTYMAERLEPMRRVLRLTGTIYLHCDPHASHYLKVLMDAVFGPANFANEIVWGYRTGGVGRRHWPRKHDVLLMYRRDAEAGFAHHPLKETVSYSKPFFQDSEAEPDAEGNYPVEVHARDVWDDAAVKAVLNMSAERLGYPTQKPLELLKRVVRASSNAGDFVLDPFCGSGTTLAAAHLLDRKWAGVDTQAKALKLAADRLRPLGATPALR